MLIVQPNFFLFKICNGEKAQYRFLLFMDFLSFAVLIQPFYTFHFQLKDFFSKLGDLIELSLFVFSFKNDQAIFSILESVPYIVPALMINSPPVIRRTC